MEVEKVEGLIVGEECIICEKQKDKGIHLYTSFICRECEHKITNAKTSDPMYRYYINKLKKVNRPTLYF
jgi:hypothetical protein